MSSNMRFSAYFDFFFNTVQTGTGPQTIIQNYIDQSTTINQQFNKAQQGAQRAGSSLRRLALDFRLVGSAISTVVTQLGLQDTAVGRVASGLQVFTATMTGVISSYNIYQRFVESAATANLTFAASAAAAQASILSFLAAAAPYIALLVVLAAAIWAANRAFERSTGIEGYRRQIKMLEENLEDLEGALKAVRLEQSALNVESRKLSVAEADLNAQFKAGLITEKDYEAAMEALSMQKALLGSQTSRLALNEAALRNITQQNTAAQEAYKESITATQQAYGPRIDIRGGGANWRSVVERSEQTPNAVQTARGGDTLTISMPGAQIYGFDGVKEFSAALTADMTKQLEYMRRTRVRD